MRSETPEYIKELAREMRKKPTEAERQLWHMLRDRRLDGFRFKRQEPVGGRYIADFYCLERKLVIELDGKVHRQMDSSEYDSLRDQTMVDAGLRSLRIRNEAVLGNLQQVIDKIKSELNTPKTPSPDAFGRGGRG